MSGADFVLIVLDFLLMLSIRPTQALRLSVSYHDGRVDCSA